MDFGTNKTPVEIIKEGAFGGIYFRDIYSGLIGSIIAQIIKMLMLINMVVSVKHH